MVDRKQIFRFSRLLSIRLKERFKVKRSAFYALFLLVSLLVPQFALAQTAQKAAVSDQYSAKLASIEEKLEKRRLELGIPGISLVIVKDGEIIYLKGLGYKDFEKKIAVTPDTQFAIGSATKAFAALSVLMTADEGKLSLDDSPKKHLPYFKMYDPETDKNMTVRDLMTHSSGLNRTDLAMITGKLNREELIKVAGEAKPMAKLREKFFYQNIMFAAAGEVVAKTQKMPWETFVPKRIFAPLGMNNSNMSVAQMEKAKDFSFGYEYNFDTKETRRLPMRPIDDVAPAGSINSSARDMAAWLRFVMNRGTLPDGKKLVSDAGFEEWIKPQINVTPNGKNAYGLGWFLQDWNGMKIVQHGGNIDGFNSMVAMIPEKKLGFVLLTNVSGSPLGNELMNVVWETFLSEPKAADAGNSETADAAKEVGRYRIEAAGVEIEVKLKDGKLTLTVPGQPVYDLENVSGRKYKLANVPAGFFITFKDTSAFLEQPQGSVEAPKVVATASAPVSIAAKELVGKYVAPNGTTIIEVKGETDGKVTFNITGQPPYALTEKSPGVFAMNPLPPAYSLKAKRDDTGKVTSVVVSQPEGEFEFKAYKAPADAAMSITPDELTAKIIEAHGGAENLKKIRSRVTVSTLDAVNQGVKGTTTTYAKLPNKSASETTMTALGKKIASGWEFFDGEKGEQLYTFSPVQKLSGKLLEDTRINSDVHLLLNWKQLYKSIEIKGTEKVGDEECYAVELSPEKGTRVVELYSKKTFLLVERRGVVASSTSGQSLPFTTKFSDYRDVDGVKIPFKMISDNSSMGEIVSIVESVKHNIEIADSLFGPKK